MIHRHTIRLPNGKWFMILLAPSSYQALGRLREHENELASVDRRVLNLRRYRYFIAHALVYMSDMNNSLAAKNRLKILKKH